MIKKAHSGRVFATMGVFDGVHKGHRLIIEKMLSFARKEKRECAVLTFHPHPQEILKRAFLPLLTSLEDRIRLIKDMGVDFVYVIPFDESLSKMRGFSFLEKIVKELDIEALFVGSDHRFGVGREVGVKELLEYSKALNLRVEVIEKVKEAGFFVSSSIIRTLLLDGRVDEANQLLGRPHFLWGIVVQGEGIGATLGYPTANIEPEAILLPKDGVYAALVQIKGVLYPGMVNIGFSPTMKKKFCIEAHVFDFVQNLYGERICLHFLKRIRNEMVFENSHALSLQIKEDENKVREILQRRYHEYIKG